MRRIDGNSPYLKMAIAIALMLAVALPQAASAITYQNVSDVFYGFSWDWAKFQVRSCDDALCAGESFIGPDNTSNTWFAWPNNTLEANFLTKTNLPRNRYFQYNAYLWTENNTRTQKLANVSLEYENETAVSTPSLSLSGAALSAQLNCAVIGQRAEGGSLNLTFRWYNNS